jgi:hypothetical protein
MFAKSFQSTNSNPWEDMLLRYPDDGGNNIAAGSSPSAGIAPENAARYAKLTLAERREWRRDNVTLLARILVPEAANKTIAKMLEALGEISGEIPAASWRGIQTGAMHLSGRYVGEVKINIMKEAVAGVVKDGDEFLSKLAKGINWDVFRREFFPLAGNAEKLHGEDGPQNKAKETPVNVPQVISERQQSPLSSYPFGAAKNDGDLAGKLLFESPGGDQIALQLKPGSSINFEMPENGEGIVIKLGKKQSPEAHKK